MEISLILDKVIYKCYISLLIYYQPNASSYKGSIKLIEILFSFYRRSLFAL